MDMNLLEVETPPSISHGCSAQRTFWEEKFTGEEKLFSAVNMKNCGRHNIRKHRNIRGSDNYVTLDISLKSDSLENMKTKSSESICFGKIRKGLITSLGFNAKIRPHKYKKARYAIRNVSKKDLYKIMTEFEKLTYESYMKKNLYEEEARA